MPTRPKATDHHEPRARFGPGLALMLLLALCLGLGSCAKPPVPDSAAPELESAWGIKATARTRPVPEQTQESITPPREASVKRLATGREPAPLPRLTPGKLPSLEPQADESGGRVLSFKDAPLGEVIPVFADLLGIKIAVPPGIKGSVNLHSGGPLRADEVLPLLVTVLEINGYGLVRQSGVFRVVPLAEAKYAPLLPRASTERVAAGQDAGFGMEVFYLTYLPADKALKTIRRFVSKAGDAASVDEANAVVIAESTPNLRKIRRILALLDVPLSRRVAVRVYQVKNVPVKGLAKDLKSILSAMGLSDKPKTGVWAEVVALEELDSIAVISSVRETFNRVEQWLADMDRQISDAEVGVFVYQCQSGDATTIAGVLTKLYGAEGQDLDQGDKDQSSYGRRTTRSTTRSTAIGSNNTTLGTASTSSGSTLRRPQDMGTEAGGGMVASQAPESQAPQGAALENGVRIVVEPNTNALVIRAPRRQYEELLRTIKRLDVFPRQVLIEVLIAEVTLDGSMELGVEWKFATSDNGTDHTAELFYSDALGLTPTSGLIYTVAQADRLKATLRALATDGKVNVVSAPLLLSAENQESHINVGEEVPIITDVTTSQNLSDSDTGTKITDRSIVYRDTGITLSITPRINDSGLVKMQVVQEITDVRDEAFGKTESPSFFKRSATTNVITTDGQSIVIAGLIQNSVEEKEAGIPYLSQIPILGYLFKTTQTIKNRTELVITLTPHVIHDMEDARSILKDLQDELGRLRKPFVGQAPVRTLKLGETQPQGPKTKTPEGPLTKDDEVEYGRPVSSSGAAQ